MNNVTRTVVLARMWGRHLSQTAAKTETSVADPRFKKLREAQKKFGIEDGTPVYLKGGVFDKLLLQVTCLVGAVGFGMSLELFYKLTFKN